MSEKKPDDKDIEVRDAIWEVMATALGEEKVELGRIRIRPFVSATANISVKAGATISLGEKTYEFARVDVMLSMPCYPEEIDAVYPKVKDWVDERMKKEVDEIKDSI